MQQLAHADSADFVPTLALDVSDAASNSSDHVAEKASASNVFIANMPHSWDESLLREHLAPFGDLLSLRVNTDRRFAFANFVVAQSAEACIATLHGTVTDDPACPLHVTRAMHSESADGPNPRLFLRGLPPDATERSLRQAAEPFGAVAEASVVVHPDGKCKGSGFIAFESLEAATQFLKARDDVPAPLRLDGDEEVQVTLTVKYSESAQTRERRQRRNRERIAERASLGQTPPTSLRGGLTHIPSSLKSARSGRSNRQRSANTPHFGGVTDAPPSPHPRTAAMAFGEAMTAAHAPKTTTASQKRSTFGVHATPGPPVAKCPAPLILKASTPAFPVSGDVFLGPVGAIESAEAAVALVANLADMPLLACPFKARSGETGFAMRFPPGTKVDTVCEALNGATFLGGAPSLSCWRFA